MDVIPTHEIGVYIMIRIQITPDPLDSSLMPMKSMISYLSIYPSSSRHTSDTVFLVLSLHPQIAA